MDKINVLFVASEYAPGMIPFAATIINTLASDTRFNISCICVNSGNQTYKGLLSENVHTIFIEYPKSKYLRLIYKFWPFSIINILQSVQNNNKFDYIHFLTGDFTLAYYIQFRNASKMCYTVHDLYPHEVVITGFINKIIFKLITKGYKKIRDKIDNLTTSSYMQVKELRKIYPYKNIEYTPFPTLITPNIINGSINISELKYINNYILFFGTVQEYKGVQLLIDAFNKSEIKEKVKLVIAGKGLNCNNITDNIIRINRFIDDNEIKPLFENAKFIIYPYLSATMSGVLSLAYFFNKSVIVSDIPFFKEYNNDLTVFFKAGDINDLSDKLNTLFYDLNFKKKITSESPYERIYSPKFLTDAYYEFYKSI